MRSPALSVSPSNVVGQRLSKHVPTATNTNATIEVLDAVCYVVRLTS
jgi:hypothetical protein